MRCSGCKRNRTWPSNETQSISYVARRRLQHSEGTGTIKEAGRRQWRLKVEGLTIKLIYVLQRKTENDPPTQESTEEIKRRQEGNLPAAERKVSQYRKLNLTVDKTDDSLGLGGPYQVGNFQE